MDLKYDEFANSFPSPPPSKPLNLAQEHTHSTTMSDVPPEVISNILTRLPVKSLLRFRCISRPVKRTIDSRSFIKAHVKGQSLHPNSDLKLVIRGHNTLFYIDVSSIGISQPQLLDHHFPLAHPVQVLSCFHGLVMISNNVNITDNALWNPSTKDFFKLPAFDFIPGKALGAAGGMTEFSGGLGYDYSTHDYKVVKIAQRFHFNDNSVASQTMVYSLKLGVWKKGKDCCKFWLISEETGTFAGGALNWLAGKDPFGSGKNLVALNLATERYQELSFPDNMGTPLTLGVLEDCLCLGSTRTKPSNPVLDHVDVWVMKDYGLKDSWVKLFCVEQLSGSQHFGHLRPLTFSATGKDVLLQMNRKKFLWYNIEKKSVRFAEISVGLDIFESFICLGTLVPCGGGN